MKKFIIIVAVLLSLMTAATAQKSQSVDQNGLHVQFATYASQASFVFPIVNGATRHSVTLAHAGPITSVLTTVEAGNANGYVVIGQSSLLSDTVSWSGAFTRCKITYSNFVGSGSLDGDYYGQTQTQIQNQ